MTTDATEVLAIGETMVLVAPDAGHRLVLGADVALAPAGAESNVAVALNGLGVRAAWYSRLGDDPLGRLVRDGLAGRGVDLAHVRVDPEHRTGVLFKSPLEGRSEVFYYRDRSAASHMDERDLDGLPVPRLVHLSGITAALSAGCRRLVERAVLGRSFGEALVSFDVNHRPSLWDSPAEAAEVLLGLARAADVVFVGRDEAERLWGTSTAESVRALLPEPAHLVVKDAEIEAVEFTPDGLVRVPSPRVEVVETVGAGDGFAAGWISALLDGADAEGRLAHGHRVAGAVLRSATDYADEAELVAASAAARR